jgi:hypothetical protein
MMRLIYILHGDSFKWIERYGINKDEDTTCRLKPIEERFMHIPGDVLFSTETTHMISLQIRLISKSQTIR